MTLATFAKPDDIVDAAPGGFTLLGSGGGQPPSPAPVPAIGDVYAYAISTNRNAPVNVPNGTPPGNAPSGSIGPGPYTWYVYYQTTSQPREWRRWTWDVIFRAGEDGEFVTGGWPLVVPAGSIVTGDTLNLFHPDDTAMADPGTANPAISGITVP
jgi:hypothetical protein